MASVPIPSISNGQIKRYSILLVNIVGYWEERYVYGEFPSRSSFITSLCFTFNPNISITLGCHSGYIFEFKLPKAENSTLDMVVHDRHISVSQVGMKSQSIFQVTFGGRLFSTFKARELRFKDKSKNPCRSEIDYNEMKVRK